MDGARSELVSFEKMHVQFHQEVERRNSAV